MSEDVFASELAQAVKAIAFVCDCDASEVVDALTGVAWDEEHAGAVKACLALTP